MAWVLLQYNGAYDRLVAECDVAMKDALVARMVQLQLKGNAATSPVTEALGDGLFELRARAKTIRIRALFGFLPGKRIVFVWGGIKDQRRLPAATIRLARNLLVEAEAVSEALNVVNIH